MRTKIYCQYGHKRHILFLLYTFLIKEKEGKGSMCCHSLLYMINIKALPVFCILKKLSCQLLFSLKFKHGTGMMLSVLFIATIHMLLWYVMGFILQTLVVVHIFLCFLVTNIFHFVLKGNKYNFGILIAHFVIFSFSKTHMKTMKDVGSFKVKFKRKESVSYKRIYAN